jgi:hypothetical protein
MRDEGFRALSAVVALIAISALSPLMANETPKKALVIGNTAYPSAPLSNPARDAIGMAAALRELGFSVSQFLDIDLRDTERAVDSFVNSIDPGDAVLIFYSGHGMQIDGDNYMIPVSFSARDEADAKYNAYSIQRVLDRVFSRKPRLTILVLDACRDNPFHSARSAVRGWAPIETGSGTYIAFATSPGSTASDGPKGANGLFTGELIKGLQHSDWTLDQLFGWVRKQVFISSKGQQLPWTSSSVIGEFVFRPSGAPNTLTQSDAAQPRRGEYLAGVRSIQLHQYSDAVRHLDSAFTPATGVTRQSSVRTLISGQREAQTRTGVVPKASEPRRATALELVLGLRPDQAIEVMRSGGDDRTTWQDHCVLSFAFLQRRQFLEAQRESEVALETAPSGEGLPYCVRANLAYALGQFGEATDNSDLCIRADPYNPVGYRIKANTLRAQDRLSEAAEAYRKAAELRGID